MKIFAVTNIKGGVGKTTTAVNLAWLCAAGGSRTLLWDLDSQGAASWLLRTEQPERAPVRKLLNGKRELDELILASGQPQLDLLPADFSYRNFAVRLAEHRHPVQRLLRMSQPLRERYDALFLDCPAGLSLLAESVLRAADVLIVPVVPAPLALRTVEQLGDFLVREGWTDLLLLAFFSLVDRRRALHSEFIADARARYPRLLGTEIPSRSEIERMSERRAPLPAFAPRSEVAGLYRSLWQEIAARSGFNAATAWAGSASAAARPPQEAQAVTLPGGEASV